MRYHQRHRKPEESIVTRGEDICLKCGCTSIHFSQARETNQTPGIPDRLYFHPATGLAFWWEAKAPDGVQQWEQQVFQALCEHSGQHYVLGGYRELFDFLHQHQLWKLPVGYTAVMFAGPLWVVKRETAEQYQRRVARRR